MILSMLWESEADVYFAAHYWRVLCSNVQTYVDRIKIRHEKFQDLVFNSNTANNSEFKDVRKGGYIYVCVVSFVVIFLYRFDKRYSYSWQTN